MTTRTASPAKPSRPHAHKAHHPPIAALPTDRPKPIHPRAHNRPPITRADPTNPTRPDHPSNHKRPFADASRGLPTTLTSRPHATLLAGVPVDLVRSRLASGGTAPDKPRNPTRPNRRSTHKRHFAAESSSSLQTTPINRPHTTFRAGHALNVPADLVSRVRSRPSGRGTKITPAEPTIAVWLVAPFHRRHFAAASLLGLPRTLASPRHTTFCVGHAMRVPVALASGVRSRLPSRGTKVSPAAPASVVWPNIPSIRKRHLAGASLGPTRGPSIGRRRPSVQVAS